MIRKLSAPVVIGLAVVGAPIRADAAPLERQPSIQRLAPTEVTIVWSTADRQVGGLDIGESLDALEPQLLSYVPRKQHEIRVRNLQPDTRYFYRVRSGVEIAAGGDADHWFRTAPLAGSTNKVRAWIAGDTGVGTEKQRAVFDAMHAATQASPPSLFVSLGDIAYGGSHEDFTAVYFEMYRRLLRSTGSWPTLGNAEGGFVDSDERTGPYFEAFVLPAEGECGGVASGTEAYYAYDYANVHFIVLDSSDSSLRPSGPMLLWARNDAETTTQPWTIAYWHHPPYANGSHNSDIEARLVTVRENVLPILEAAGVDLVLAGHSHAYERTYLLDGAYDTPSVAGLGVLDSGDGRVLGDGPYVKPPGRQPHAGTVYVVAGHGGASVSGPSDHPLSVFSEGKRGSCILDVHDNRLTLTNLRDDGVVTDRVDVVKGDAIVLAKPNGGEHLLPRSVYEILWRTVGPAQTVTLSYSSDDGQTWSTIAQDVENSGSYKWTLPAEPSEHGQIRVEQSAGGALVDETNGAFRIAALASRNAISFGEQWRFNDAGLDLGTAWLEAAYDDSAWPEGPAQLGYGEGDEATIAGALDTPAVYFRKTITVTEMPVRAELSLFFDAGIVVWINGHQVHHDNADTASYDGLGTTPWIHDNEVRRVSIDASPFFIGENVVAAMVKQSDLDSAELSFDLALDLAAAAGPPAPNDADTGDDSAPGTDDSGTNADGSSGGAPTGGPDFSESEHETVALNAATSSCACRSDRTPSPSTGALMLLLLGLRRRASGVGGVPLQPRQPPPPARRAHCPRPRRALRGRGDHARRLRRA